MESNNIIIKILKNNSANDLIKHQHIWNLIVKSAKNCQKKNMTKSFCTRHKHLVCHGHARLKIEH